MKIRIVLLLLLVFPAGCSLTPKTYQLEQIHQNYTTEWTEWSSASVPTARIGPVTVDGKGRFKTTLAGIKNYKQRYGNTSKVAAHLTILEGMIYIQSGKPGMAKLLLPDVQEAMPRLKSGTGLFTRDYIFASCFKALTQGWTAIYKNGVNVKPEDFIGPADRIAKQLKNIPPENRAAGDVDSGGAYVATSAAIFYLWAHAAAPEAFKRADMAEKGAAVLKPWLSRSEINAVENGTFKNPEFEWGGRLRFMEWYAFLHTEAGR